ncbi:rCG44594, isoform CRA_a [Rattus norvegicus]|uniref:RCG44594, isoform CRA_a n=1 Tax=Rattus norvegicus TaxID=10116 RepID=A6I5I6_RAT|nr:rCG44594, isoform CRA_a [Rattus norvegicus]EDM10295.1 rCG44594, isoform CRA_a [Rattus norvegicus]
MSYIYNYITITTYRHKIYVNMLYNIYKMLNMLNM